MLTNYTDDRGLPPYMICPRSLRKWRLNGTEVMLYLSVLDRCRLSARHTGWRTAGGDPWCCYTVRALAADLGRGESAVKLGLRGLEDKGLLRRERQGLGKPDRLIVFVPREDEEDCPAEAQSSDAPEVCGPASPEGWETASPEGRKSGSLRDGNPPPSKNYRERTIEQKQGSRNPAARPRHTFDHSYDRDGGWSRGSRGYGYGGYGSDRRSWQRSWRDSPVPSDEEYREGWE